MNSLFKEAQDFLIYILTDMSVAPYAYLFFSLSLFFFYYYSVLNITISGDAIYTLNNLCSPWNKNFPFSLLFFSLPSFFVIIWCHIPRPECQACWLVEMFCKRKNVCINFPLEIFCAQSLPYTSFFFVFDKVDAY